MIGNMMVTWIQFTQICLCMFWVVWTRSSSRCGLGGSERLATCCPVVALACTTLYHFVPLCTTLQFFILLPKSALLNVVQCMVHWKCTVLCKVHSGFSHIPNFAHISFSSYYQNLITKRLATSCPVVEQAHSLLCSWTLHTRKGNQPIGPPKNIVQLLMCFLNCGGILHRESSGSTTWADLKPLIRQITIEHFKHSWTSKYRV